MIGKEDLKHPYIFEMTLAEVREHFSKTQNYQDSLLIGDEVQIPTLNEVFDALERKVVINIEVKTPEKPEIHAKYDIERLVRILHSNLTEDVNVSYPGLDVMKAHNHCFISSFDHEFLRMYERV